jgi:hypothetical protein
LPVAKKFDNKIPQRDLPEVFHFPFLTYSDENGTSPTPESFRSAYPLPDIQDIEPIDSLIIRKAGPHLPPPLPEPVGEGKATIIDLSFFNPSIELHLKCADQNAPAFILRALHSEGKARAASWTCGSRARANDIVSGQHSRRVDVPEYFLEWDQTLRPSYTLERMTPEGIYNKIVHGAATPGRSPDLYKNIKQISVDLLTRDDVLAMIEAKPYLVYLAQYPEPTTFDPNHESFRNLWAILRKFVAQYAELFWIRTHWPFNVPGIAVDPRDEFYLPDEESKERNRLLFRHRMRYKSLNSRLPESILVILKEVRHLISLGVCSLSILVDPVFPSIPHQLFEPIPWTMSAEDTSKWTQEHSRPWLSDGSRGKIDLVLLCQHLDELEPWRRTCFVPVEHHHWFKRSSILDLDFCKAIRADIHSCP